MDKNAILVLGAFVFIVLFPIIFRRHFQEDKRVLKSIYRREFISYQDFEKGWIITRPGKKVDGYKYRDTSGCYVILIFKKPVRNKNYKHYENVYVGQSINICKRVHNHFRGRGNGDVYFDIKSGKSVYVQLIPCAREKLNDQEKKLIKAFQATQSYNKTSGGSRQILN